VALSSNNTAVATVPASVTVPAGTTSANFPIRPQRWEVTHGDHHGHYNGTKTAT